MIGRGNRQNFPRAPPLRGRPRRIFEGFSSRLHARGSANVDRKGARLARRRRRAPCLTRRWVCFRAAAHSLALATGAVYRAPRLRRAVAAGSSYGSVAPRTADAPGRRAGDLGRLRPRCAGWHRPSRGSRARPGWPRGPPWPRCPSSTTGVASAPCVRLAVHGVAGAATAVALAGPPAGETIASARGRGRRVTLVIVWSANLFNFMDGSDGLAAATAMSGFGAYGFAAWQAREPAEVYVALAVAVVPFLAVNLPPARAFMGDVGAVPLGFLAATFGLAGCRNGTWPRGFPCSCSSHSWPTPR